MNIRQMESIISSMRARVAEDDELEFIIHSCLLDLYFDGVAGDVTLDEWEMKIDKAFELADEIAGSDHPADMP